jgi:pantothenate kinase
MAELSFATLVDMLSAAQSATGRRQLVALAGPPGVGKSTTAEALKAALNARNPGLADILPMDGYHFDDAVLHMRGHRPRKGAPHTFDLDGFAAMLVRVKADTGKDIAVPVFDRGLEIARAGGRIVSGATRIVLVEGNYLLLDAEGWRDLRPLFDVTVQISAPEATIVQRLLDRWTGIGLSPDALTAKMEENDLPNLRLVLAQSLAADFVLPAL